VGLFLIDMDGRIVKHWKMPGKLGSGVKLLPNGNQIRINRVKETPSAFLGTGGSRLAELDWDGNEVWVHEDDYMHHDFTRLPNGNTLLNRHVLIPDDIASKVKGGMPGSEEEGRIWGNAYREITPDGEAVWDWIGHEHLDPEIDVPCALCPRSIWGYVNGIDVFPNGDIVGSFRHLNNLIIVDRQIGEIKWRWGKWELGHQHNPTVLDNGNILLFDNGCHRLGSYDQRHRVTFEGFSRVIEVNPQTDEIEWEYKENPPTHFWSSVCSSAQRLPNGNTLICEAVSGRIFEVTREKEIVWEFVNPIQAPSVDSGHMGISNLVYKATRYSYNYSAFQGKDLDPDRAEWVLQYHD
jgi:hypothetical protein